MNKDDFLAFVQATLIQNPEWSGGVTHVMTIALTESVRLSKVRAADMEAVAYLALNKASRLDKRYMADLLEKNKGVASLYGWEHTIDKLRSKK